MQVRYESERMEQELRLMEQENLLAQNKVRQTRMFFFGISGLLGVMLFMVLIYIRQNKLKTENLQIPPMLVQPFIENAIEHGIRHKKGKSRINIRMRREHQNTICEVEDDGIGRQKALEILRQKDAGHKSMVTDITRERIAALNKKHKTHITLEIIDLKDEKGEARGTRVVLVIPSGR
jgi:LytS/YehU family sensor histidine kinase